MGRAYCRQCSEGTLRKLEKKCKEPDGSRAKIENERARPGASKRAADREETRQRGIHRN